MREERNMNELQIFENKDFGKIRVWQIKGQPWFVGKDVADVLGYLSPFISKCPSNKNCYNKTPAV